MRRLVQGYGATFEKDGNPFASPKAIATWACYVLDKYEIGLLDAATLAGVDEARRCCRESFRAPCASSRTTPSTASASGSRLMTSPTFCPRTCSRRTL